MTQKITAELAWRIRCNGCFVDPGKEYASNRLRDIVDEQYYLANKIAELDREIKKMADEEGK